jgi:hypothetical protein
MKKLVLLFVAGVLAAACSSPKYTYEFGKHDYNAGKRKHMAQAEAVVSGQTLETAVASAEETPVVTNEVAVPASVAISKETVKEVTKNLSKDDRKELKKDLKKEIKTYVKAVKKKDVKSVSGTKAMDRHLKMAAIFGAVGLVLTLLGGVNSVFWVLGVISIVIGVVFFIQWLSRQ